MAQLLNICVLGASVVFGRAVSPSWACDTPLNGLNLANGTLQFHASKRDLQKTEAATAASLASYVQQRSHDLLLVFYAPWCGHCKGFVLHDAAGNPANAPLELLNNELVAAKGPKVLKYDIQANGNPSQFEVQFVPTIYLRSKAGVTTAYAGDAHDIAALKAFALQGSTLVAPGVVAMHAKPALRTTVVSQANPVALSAWGRVSSGGCDLPDVKPVQLHAVTNGQQVEAITQSSLTSYVREGTRDLLLVFYAPWCGHCKQFVLADGNGVPEKAPIELLNNDLLAAKGPTVLKYDAEANDWPDQSQFRTEYVPTIYLAEKNGQKKMYEGDALDLPSLKSFALQNVK